MFEGYGCLNLPLSWKLIFNNMQKIYVNMQPIFVNTQHDYADMRDNNLMYVWCMQGNYDWCWHKILHVGGRRTQP